MPITPTQRFRAQGLTLTELLIAAAIGGLILAAAARIITSDVRSSSNQEAIQRLRDHWGRVNFFIDTEVREGTGLSQDAGTGTCTAASSPSLTISVPNGTGGTSHIYYYDQGGNLWRCGPDIKADGSLDFDLNSNGILVENATLESTIVNAKNVSYTLTLSSRSSFGGIQYEATSEARTSGRSCDATSGICY